MTKPRCRDRRPARASHRRSAAWAPAFSTCTRHSQRLWRGCSQSATPYRTPAASPSHVKRSFAAPKPYLGAGSDSFHDCRLRGPPAGYRRAIPPWIGEPWTWLISVRPRSCWCSIANTHPLGRTLIERPDRLAMRRRPSPLLGTSRRHGGASSVVSVSELGGGRGIADHRTDPHGLIAKTTP